MIVPNGVQDTTRIGRLKGKYLVIHNPVTEILTQGFRKFMKITKIADFEKKF